MAIDYVIFDSMLKRAREYRRRVDMLGKHGAEIDGNVLARLAGRLESADLPPATAGLADEIFALLANPRLSQWQAHSIRREFFTHGGETSSAERSPESA